jgi:hypothetical protein
VKCEKSESSDFPLEEALSFLVLISEKSEPLEILAGGNLIYLFEYIFPFSLETYR